jgi:PAS domain S-box-containing protein
MRAAGPAVRTTLDQFRLLAENVPVICWLADATGHTFWYNRRWYEYTGTTPAEIEGWGWQSVHDPLTLPEALDRWKVTLATGQPFEMVFPLRSAEGEYRPFLTRVVPFRGAEGRITHWCGANIDISAQRVAEEALRSATMRLRGMLDALPIMASLQKSDGEPEFLNRRYSDYLGDPPAGIFAGRLEVVHPDDQAALLDARKRALGEGAGTVEVRLRRRDGTWRWHSVRWITFDAESPDPRFLVTSVDIHDLHEAADRVAKSEEQLRLAVEAAEVGLWDVDPVNDTLYWPPRVKAMFGISPDVAYRWPTFMQGFTRKTPKGPRRPMRRPPIHPPEAFTTSNIEPLARKMGSSAGSQPRAGEFSTTAAPAFA